MRAMRWDDSDRNLSLAVDSASGKISPMSNNKDITTSLPFRTFVKGSLGPLGKQVPLSTILNHSPFVYQ